MDGSSDPNIGDTVLSAAGYCGGTSGHGGVWKPDLRRNESLVDVDWMIKF
jgi:hypothetical protein